MCRVVKVWQHCRCDRQVDARRLLICFDLPPLLPTHPSSPPVQNRSGQRKTPHTESWMFWHKYQRGTDVRSSLVVRSNTTVFTWQCFASANESRVKWQSCYLRCLQRYHIHIYTCADRKMFDRFYIALFSALENTNTEVLENLTNHWNQQQTMTLFYSLYSNW